MKVNDDPVLMERIRKHMQERNGAGEELKGIIRVNIEHIEHLHFRGTATEGRGLSIDIDESPERGGEGNGVTPLETFLMGAGSCLLTQFAALIITGALKVDTMKATVSGNIDRRVYGLFTGIEIEVWLTGSEDRKAIVDAAGTSGGLCKNAQGLCYVHNTLMRAVSITTRVYMNGELVYADKTK
ncbi:MAG: OsmC family protein [Nitrososphaerota archaeon]|jgi:uncharacterized OsmC-like protein|nr:OsmC family protein [Nitrososphaerota archaeon]MDG6927870.1 OsmC family protein [Nitrososphaerota archaeon]MDG6932125.1 OsmC family protein [Nitrososphaerota archaeon]MDG6936680.1 OsmC family protein [Nitrososphaerota archaeon]MDG6944286.1 OsmC family protein [Nitrososphaerota archaeon]